ncbi:MAG: hypothetical protein Q8N60_02055 [Candidatus Diapherotrites archaeon]|nr:hypothetical protein [Candidatus Diapherotrites archaeon]
MDWQKIFQAIMLPFALAVALSMASYVIPLATNYSMGGSYYEMGEYGYYEMGEYAMTLVYLSIAIALAAFVGGTAALVWAGYRTAKALQGGAVEGGIGAVVLSVLSSITIAVLSFVVSMAASFWMPSNSTTFATSNLLDINSPYFSTYFIMYILFFTLATIAWAIWGFLMGAIGGAIARSQQPPTAAAATKPKTSIAIVATVVLAVIVFIVGGFLVLILIFMPGPPPTNVYCSSSDPAKIMVKASQVDNSFELESFDVGIIKLTNITGGDILAMSCVGSGAFEEAIDASDGCTATVSSGTEITLKPDSGTIAGRFNVSTIKISYKDYADFSRTATITCSGPITVS